MALNRESLISIRDSIDLYGSIFGEFPQMTKEQIQQLPNLHRFEHTPRAVPGSTTWERNPVSMNEAYVELIVKPERAFFEMQGRYAVTFDEIVERSDQMSYAFVPAGVFVVDVEKHKHFRPCENPAYYRGSIGACQIFTDHGRPNNMLFLGRCFRFDTLPAVDRSMPVLLNQKKLTVILGWEPANE